MIVRIYKEKLFKYIHVTIYDKYALKVSSKFHHGQQGSVQFLPETLITFAIVITSCKLQVIAPTHPAAQFIDHWHEALFYNEPPNVSSIL